MAVPGHASAIKYPDYGNNWSLFAMLFLLLDCGEHKWLLHCLKIDIQPNIVGHFI